MHEILETLALTNSPKFLPYFQRIREAFPEQLIRVCVRHLAKHEMGPSEKLMADWLITGERYLAFLIESDELTMSEAHDAAKVLQVLDPKFFAKLSDFTEKAQRRLDTDALTRALNLIEGVGEYSALIPRLNSLTNYDDKRIRSKAVKALCALRSDKEQPSRLAWSDTLTSVIKRQLQSEDPRIRANAIEGIWHIQSEELEQIFRASLSDNHHRVVINALLGLYYQNKEGSLDRLLELANHSSPRFRAAAAWAFGRLADPRTAAALEKLAGDTSEEVKKRARASLTQLAASPEQLPQ